MKYGKGQRKGYEKAHLKEQHHHVKFGIYHISGVWKNPSAKIFHTSRDTWRTKNILPPMNMQQSHTNIVTVFLMFIATIQRLSYKGQESKTLNLQFMFLTTLSPWNKVRVIKSRITMYAPRNVITMQSWKDLALIVSEKKSMLKFVSLFQERKNVSNFPWTWAKIKIVIFHDLLHILSSRAKFQFNRIRT